MQTNECAFITGEPQGVIITHCVCLFFSPLNIYHADSLPQPTFLTGRSCAGILFPALILQRTWINSSLLTHVCNELGVPIV